MPRKPVTPEQLAANRANARRSTGPRTPEGKARSAQNAVKHGFTASSFVVVRLEELDEVENLKQDLISVYQPVNAQELLALERAALAQQSMFRAARLESGFFTACIDEAYDTDGDPIRLLSRDMLADNIPVLRAQNRNFGLAAGFDRSARRSNTFTLILRYQAQAERQYRRAMEEFDRLKSLRSELPNEPISSDPAPDPDGERSDAAPTSAGQNDAVSHPQSPNEPISGYLRSRLPARAVLREGVRADKEVRIGRDRVAGAFCG